MQLARRDAISEEFDESELTEALQLNTMWAAKHAMKEEELRRSCTEIRTWLPPAKGSLRPC